MTSKPLLASQYVAVAAGIPAVGAIGGALDVLLGDGPADPDVLHERLQRGTTVALRPWG